ncbi:MAG: helix-turn-helix domain-containing protein [Candidatus Binataceae bacterium]
MVRLGSSVHEVERELIVRTVAHAKGNKARAAEILGMSRRNLYNRLDQYSLHETNGHLNGRSYRNGRSSLT